MPNLAVCGHLAFLSLILKDILGSVKGCHKVSKWIKPYTNSGRKDPGENHRKSQPYAEAG